MNSTPGTLSPMNGETHPDASVIIVSYNARKALRACLGSLAAAIGGREIDTLMVDNASRDASTDMVATEFP